MTAFPIGQGHGLEGRYAGLPEPFCQRDSAKIAIISVPFGKGVSYQKGTEKGPAAIIEASRYLELYDIETNSDVYLQGICTVPPVVAETAEDMLEGAYQDIMCLMKEGKFVVALGGEHTISYAPIRAYSEVYPGLSVLQFDAHADLQDTYEGSPWSHACVMARVAELPGVDKIVSVGVRSLSRLELKNLSKTLPFFCHDLFADDSWMEKVLQGLGDNVYITFDLDVFDSSIMSSTGTPEPGGLFWPQVTKLLKLVAERKNLLGFDVVELCPSLADLSPDFLAAKLVYKILSYKFGLVQKWEKSGNTLS